MAKAKTSEAPAKAKYQQTKLCFSSFAPSNVTKTEKDKKKFAETQALERSIQDLSISKLKEQENHPDPCKKCSKYVKRIKCTAINFKSEKQCPLSFCEECVFKKVKEDWDWINNNSNGSQFVNKSGKAIKHNDASSKKWACLVCRGICDCKYCLKGEHSGPKLSFNIEPIKTQLPPDLKPLNLLYSEEELWVRLQIREFIYRFGDLYGLENRILSCLQNVQGDWRVKRFGAYIVWQFLKIMYTTPNFEFTLPDNNQESIQLVSKRIMNNWIREKKLDNLCYDREGKDNAMLEILYSEGMTGKRWQDMAQLLCFADFKDIPIPITTKIARSDDDMDIDEENEDVKRYQKCNNRSLISAKDEMTLINMLLELLLFDSQIRQNLVPSAKNAQSKELKDEILELKTYQKEWTQENIQHNINKSLLNNRINQLKSTKGKDAELKQARIDLDELETLIRDETHNLSKRKLEVTIRTLKAEKRMNPLGLDMLGNEYWIFNDVLDHINNASDFRNTEPYWAYGVIIIGPGFDNAERTWWSVNGKDQMNVLKDWLLSKSQSEKEHQQALKKIAAGIEERISYIALLETVCYGEGFFQ